MVTRTKPDPYLIDDENPELTDRQVAALRPAVDVLAALGLPVPARRGKQKTPTKVLVSVRLDQDVVDHLRASGRGWQTRLNDLARVGMGLEAPLTSKGK